MFNAGEMYIVRLIQAYHLETTFHYEMVAPYPPYATRIRP
jgi:hypothetical protein